MCRKRYFCLCPCRCTVMLSHVILVVLLVANACFILENHELPVYTWLLLNASTLIVLSYSFVIVFCRYYACKLRSSPFQLCCSNAVHFPSHVYTASHVIRTDVSDWLMNHIKAERSSVPGSNQVLSYNQTFVHSFYTGQQKKGYKI